MWNGVFSPNMRKDYEPDGDGDDSAPGHERERFKDHIRILRTEKTIAGLIAVTVAFANSPDKEYTFEFNEDEYEDSLEKVAELILAYWEQGV